MFAGGAAGQIDAGEFAQKLLGGSLRDLGQSGMKSQQLAALRESEFFGSVGEIPEVTDAHEASGEDMEEKASDKLLGVKGHRFQPVFVFSVPVAKSDLAVFDGEDTVIGQRDAVSVAAEIVKDRLW